MDRTASMLSRVTVPIKGGRPKVGKRRDVRLSDEHWQYLVDVGEGQAARGLRKLIDAHKARHNTKPPKAGTGSVCGVGCNKGRTR